MSASVWRSSSVPFVRVATVISTGAGGIGRATWNGPTDWEGSSMRRFQYDYYTCDVPGDCADSVEELASLAINECRDRARLYCLPALWAAVRVAGDVGDWTVRFRVCRKRNKRQPCAA